MGESFGNSLTYNPAFLIPHKWNEAVSPDLGKSWETASVLSQRCGFVGLFGMTAAAALSVAGTAAGTADTLDATLLCLMDVTASQTDDNSNDCKNDVVFHGFTSFRSAYMQRPDSDWCFGSGKPL